MSAIEAIKRLREMDAQLIDGKVRIFKQISDMLVLSQSALNRIASWNKGRELESSPDELSIARVARQALKEMDEAN